MIITNLHNIFTICTAADNDYDPSILVDIDLSSSTTSMGECISAAVIPDSVLEGDERFTLTINGNPEVNLSPTMSQAQIVIVNDDGKFVGHTYVHK